MAPDEVADATLTASRALLGVAALSLTEALEVVTPPQFRALVILSGAGPMPIGALARRLGANASTFSRNLDKMVRDGWVERVANPDNRREVLVRLTAAGAGLVSDVTERRRREIARIVGKLDTEDQLLLLRAFELFNSVAGEVPVEHVLSLSA